VNETRHITPITLSPELVSLTRIISYFSPQTKGTKLFPSFPKDASIAYKFVAMVLQCTGGGILVPIFINSIPVPLAQDAYPIAILTSFVLHQYFPVVRDVMKLSPVLKTAIIVLYETMRASVVVKLTTAAGKAIAASDFAFPVFGPIFCGTIAGCGGAFLPLSKGLDPIKEGLAQPMLSSFVAASFYHLFNSTSVSDGVKDAAKKSHVMVTYYFIAYHLYTMYYSLPKVKKEGDKTKKE